MCLSPINIPNPNYGRHDKLSYLVDTRSRFIGVPCGHCTECIANRQMNFVQRIQMESVKNHLFFSTLTYNNEMLPVLDVNGYKIKYADYHDFNNVVRRIRRQHLFPRPFRYFAVQELGSRRGRPHFHCLWLVPKQEGDDFLTCMNLEHEMYDILLSVWQRNVGSRKFPEYKNLCTFKRIYTKQGIKSNYDFHYVNPFNSTDGVNNVSWYVLKYMLKPSDRVSKLHYALRKNLCQDEFDRVWKIVRPRCFMSKDLGLSKDQDIVTFLRDNIEKHKFSFDYPVFVNANTGQTFPLSKFYRSKGDIFDVDLATYFFYNGSGKERNVSHSDLVRGSSKRDRLSVYGEEDRVDFSIF